jgi:hypothetical protein
VENLGVSKQYVDALEDDELEELDSIVVTVWEVGGAGKFSGEIECPLTGDFAKMKMALGTLYKVKGGRLNFHEKHIFQVNCSLGLD